MKTTSKHIIFFVVIVVLFAGCSMKKGKDAAERAVEKFHNQLNAGQFREIYAEADEGFKKAAKEEDAIALFDGVRRKLGTVQKATLTGWHVNAAMGGNAITLGYDVEFSGGKAVEQFVYRQSGDKVALFNYNVNSPVLLK